MKKSKYKPTVEKATHERIPSFLAGINKLIIKPITGIRIKI
jgi:hypothetical protein